MQSKLSKLQKEMLEYIYKNQKVISELFGFSDSSFGRALKKFQETDKGEYVKRINMFYDIAKRHGKYEHSYESIGFTRDLREVTKVIPGKISKSYYPTLINSLNSLVRRKLVKILWKDFASVDQVTGIDKNGKQTTRKKGLYLADKVPMSIMSSKGLGQRESRQSLFASPSLVQLTDEGKETAQQLLSKEDKD